MPLYTTACPRNCYSTCTMKVHIRDKRLRMIEPHRENQATTEGVCLKGLSYVERVYSPDRLLTPLRKDGDRFVQISWPEALDEIVHRIKDLQERYGAQSILYYSASGTKGLLNEIGMNFWRLFGGCTTTYGDLCWPAGLEATRLTLGENKHNVPWDLANARLIIMWGKNAAETNVHQMPFVEKAQRAGAKLVVIDPRRTQTAAGADLIIQPRPGTDGALALATAHLLIRNNKTDLDFILKYVSGYPEFREMVENFTPQMAADICRIPMDKIEQLASYIGTIAPLTINTGYGMQRYTNSGQTMRAIIALLALTGNIGKPGAGWIFANLQTQVFDAVKDPLALYPPAETNDPVRVTVSTTKLGGDILTASDPPIKMMWVERGNPVTQNPETHSVLKAIRGLEFRVVIDQFLTDTAREADIILPAKTMFEQTDVIGAYWHPYIQIKQKVIEPPGEVKPESEIYHALALRLGKTASEIKELIPGPSEKDIESYLEKKLSSFADLSLDILNDGPVIAPGHQEIAFSDYEFNTPSGKIELVSREASQRWQQDSLPVFKEAVESALSGSCYPLHFLTPNTKNRIHSQFNNLKLIRQFSPEPYLEINPADAEVRGIVPEMKVRVFNDRGELRVKARPDFAIKRGCVAISNGWWIREGGTVNFCSAARETDMGHGAAFHDNMVEVEKV